MCFVCNKMKLIISLVFILYAVYAQDVEKGQGAPVKQISETKCFPHTSSRDTYDQLAALLQYSLKDPQAAKLDNFCKTERAKISSSLDNDFSSTPCLPKEEKYLSQFLKDAMMSFTEFVCQSESLYMKIFFSSQGKVCWEHLLHKTEEIRSCLSREWSKNDRNNKYLTEDVLCSAINLHKRCTSEAINEYCPRFPDYQALNMEFFNSLSSPCSASCNLEVINLVIYLSAIVTLFYIKFA